MTHRVLLVDDEPDICALLQITLKRMQIASDSAGDLATAYQLLDANTYDLCLTDMNLPDGNGIELVSRIHKHFPGLPVAMITAYGNMETAILALKSGAFDFITKPLDVGQLRMLVNAALELQPPPREAPDTAPANETTGLIGDTPVMKSLRAQIAKAARSRAPIHITGESGTGKELVARLIHQHSCGPAKPFIAVNCGAIPGELLESEFFGYRKGSFTGAVKDQPGLIRSAAGGTLFLDEISELPLSMQVKLLRVIQEKAIRPIGEPRETPVDFRLVSATHKSLHEAVSSGEFRQDLFFRIHVIPIEVPALRQRREDIPLLANHFLHKSAGPDGAVMRLSAAALAALKSHSFPGNVRELENMLERGIAMAESSQIEADDLFFLQDSLTPIQLGTAREDNESLSEFVERIEKQTILDALAETNGNRTAAAKKLGISFRALRYRLQKLGIQ